MISQVYKLDSSFQVSCMHIVCVCVREREIVCVSICVSNLAYFWDKFKSEKMLIVQTNKCMCVAVLQFTAIINLRFCDVQYLHQRLRQRPKRFQIIYYCSLPE